MTSRRLLFFIAFTFFASGLWAQFALHIQYPHRNDFDFLLEGEVALIHEKTSVVERQQGTWEYELQPPEESALYRFQDDNQLEEYIRFRKGGAIAAKVRLEYTEVAGKSLPSQAIDDKSVVSFEYDNKGRLTGIRNMFGERLLSRSEFTYGSRRQSTQYVLMDDQTFYFEHKSRNGLVQEMSKIDSMSGLAFKANYSYNEQGWLQTAESQFTKEGLAKTVLEYTYQLDEQGNWIQRLEHNRANGFYRLTQRTIIYQSDLATASETETPAGFYTCGTSPYFLQVLDNGYFTIFDATEGDVYQGSWVKTEYDRFRFRFNQDLPIGSPYPFRQTIRLLGEMRTGRLVLYIEGEYHLDFIHESVLHISEELQLGMRRARWSKNRYSKDPALKQEAQVPADIDAAFDETRALGPDRIQACLDGKCGVIDRNGTVIIPFAYEQLDIMDENRYLIIEEGKRGVINTLGEQILEAKYDRIWAEPKLGRRIMGTRLDGERYYYDLDRGDFLPFEKEQIREWNNLRWVIRDGRFVNLYDNDFNRITRDSSYNRITILGPNRYLAGGRDAYRIIDENGQELKVFTGYLKVKPATFGYLLAFSATNQQYALFNTEGEQITEALYQELEFCDSRNPNSNDCRLLRFKPAIARFKKPNGQQGSLTGLGQELR